MVKRGDSAEIRAVANLEIFVIAVNFVSKSINNDVKDKGN